LNGCQRRARLCIVIVFTLYLERTKSVNNVRNSYNLNKFNIAAVAQW